MRHAREDYDRIQDPAGKIGEDEPVFLVRAQDNRMLAVLYFYRALAEIDGDKRMVEVISQHIEATKAWQAAHPTKPGDLP